MLTFNAEHHVYHWNGTRVPSVTQCLDKLIDFSMVPPSVLERKRQIGVAVHKAIHLELTGALDHSTIDPACAPYFAAWLRFKAEMDFEPMLVEFRVYNDELGEGFAYAGTLDEWGFLQGHQTLIDWKTTFVLNVPAVGAQTAAYLKALVRMKLGAALSDRRYALKLGSNGTYKLERYRDFEDDWLRFVRELKQWHNERSEV